jgi:Mu-like prophage I protein
MNANTMQTLAGAYVVALAESNLIGQEPQWVHLLPVGEFSASDGRGPWLVESPEQVIANTLKNAGTKLIPVDYDHQIDHKTENGQPAIAAGWITQFEARDNGIWGLVEWTDKARAHLAAKEYRYISPVIKYKSNGEVTSIARAALVNNPALELTALASEQESSLQAALSDTKAKLEAALAVQKQMEETALLAKIERHAECGHILPCHKEFSVKLAKIDPQLFEEFASYVRVFTKPLFQGFQSRGLSPENRGIKTPTRLLDETEQAICHAMGHTQEEFIQLGAKDDH